MSLRACVYVCTRDEFGAKEKRVSVEKSESECRDVKQSESCEKENRVYRELRELRTQCTLY